jgi:hypothetical protein
MMIVSEHYGQLDNVGEPDGRLVNDGRDYGEYNVQAYYPAHRTY